VTSAAGPSLNAFVEHVGIYHLQQPTWELSGPRDPGPAAAGLPLGYDAAGIDAEFFPDGR
jgi:hypothetical protein